MRRKVGISVLQGFQILAQKKRTTIYYMHHISLFKRSGILRLTRIWAQKFIWYEIGLFLFGIIYGPAYSLLCPTFPPSVSITLKLNHLDPVLLYRTLLISLFTFNGVGTFYEIPSLENQPFLRKTCFPRRISVSTTLQLVDLDPVLLYQTLYRVFLLSKFWVIFLKPTFSKKDLFSSNGVIECTSLRRKYEDETLGNIKN